MYSIVTENPEQIPSPDNLPLKLIVHPALTGDTVKLIAYIIGEYHHNPRAAFIKELCIKHCGVKRVALNAAINKLTELHVLSLYNNGPDKTPIVELDFTGLLELVELSPFDIQRAGFSKAALDKRRTQLSKD